MSVRVIDKKTGKETIGKYALVKDDEVSLVYAARDGEHNNARVLEELVAGLMKNLP